MKKIEVLKMFRDKTTSDVIDEQKILNVGDVIECEDELADSRIALGLAKEVEETKTDKKTRSKE